MHSTSEQELRANPLSGLFSGSGVLKCSGKVISFNIQSTVEGFTLALDSEHTRQVLHIVTKGATT